jgi:restriction system protein
MNDILSALTSPKVLQPEKEEEKEDLKEIRKETVRKAHEFIKDEVSKLDWEDVQQLVAGILRAMGYKTRVSPPGADRGKDVEASPDGLGLGAPHIIAEVKHREGSMGASQIRIFIGALRERHRGLRQHWRLYQRSKVRS